MARAKLTDRKLKALKRKGKRYKGKRYDVMDTEVSGFGVRVSEIGQRTFLVARYPGSSNPNTSGARGIPHSEPPGSPYKGKEVA